MLVNPNIDRANSNFDIRHSFTAGVTYNLPSPQSNRVARAAFGGWSVDSSVLARSAQPVDLVVPTLEFLVGVELFLRPNVTRECRLCSTARNIRVARLSI